MKIVNVRVSKMRQIDKWLTELGIDHSYEYQTFNAVNNFELIEREVIWL